MLFDCGGGLEHRLAFAESASACSKKPVMRKQQEAQTAKECAKSVVLYSLLIKLASPIYAREGKGEG